MGGRKEGRECEGEREMNRGNHLLVHSTCVVKEFRLGKCKSLEPGAQSRFSFPVIGTQLLEPKPLPQRT